MASFKEIINNNLWAEYRNDASFPRARPLWAHYTSLTNFEKIIMGEEIWFSSPLYMNDREELLFGLSEGAAAFIKSEKLARCCRSVERHNRVINIFQQLLNEFYTKHILSTYVACFSEHQPEDNDGLLSMWRGYGDSGSGAAIIFDSKKIEHRPGASLIIDKVHYATTAKRFDWIERHIAVTAETIEKFAETDDDLFSAAAEWLHRLKMFSLFSKHSGFHEEREWRVVYMSEKDPDVLFKSFFGHVATNKGIEPKLKLPIKPIENVTSEDLSMMKIIDRIILGPSVSNVLSLNSLRLMLNNNGRQALAQRVVASSIPYRSNR